MITISKIYTVIGFIFGLTGLYYLVTSEALSTPWLLSLIIILFAFDSFNKADLYEIKERFMID